MIILNALATRAGGAAVRVGEVARRAPALWGCPLLVLSNPEAQLGIDPSADRVLAGWPPLLQRAPAVPRRVWESHVVGRHVRQRGARAVIHYGTYVPIPLRTASTLNVLYFVSLAPWDPGLGGRTLRNRTLRWLFEGTERFADVIVVQSQATADFMRERYPRLAGRLHVVRNGVSIPRMRRPECRRGFLVLGDVYAYRRIDDVIRAYASLDPHVRAAHPLIVAGNLHRDRAAVHLVTKAIAECGVTNVQLRGLVPRREALALMAGVCALVSYATVENGPNGIIEAAAMDVPLVLSDIPVHREFAGHRARFAMTASELRDSLASAIGTSSAASGEYTVPVETWDEHVAQLGSILAACGVLPGSSMCRVHAPPSVPANRRRSEQ